jgi:hypothetical protein
MLQADLAFPDVEAHQQNIKLLEPLKTLDFA